MLTWEDVLSVEGFSSAANRRILNQAVATVPRARILEIGSYCGSTAVAMCHGNDVECIHLVDNHSEFGNVRASLSGNCERFALPATIHDFDWFAPLPSDAFGGTRFNVYHYDGSHIEEQHAKELSIAWPHLEDEFVYIVDDYSWDAVHRGCDRGLVELGKRVNIVKRNVYQSSVTNDTEGYWNGLLVAWCEKV